MASSAKHHVVDVPSFFLVLKYIQCTLAVAVLGLSVFPGNIPAVVLGALSFIMLAYFILSSLCCTVIYNRWFALVFEILNLLWWMGALVSSALFAIGYSVFDHYSYDSSTGTSWYGDYDDHDNYYVKNIKSKKTVSIIAAVVAALTEVLFLITLIVYSVYLHRHRRSGAPATRSGQWKVMQAQPVVVVSGSAPPGQPGSYYMQPMGSNQTSFTTQPVNRQPEGQEKVFA